jgi:hypothetical protein
MYRTFQEHFCRKCTRNICVRLSHLIDMKRSSYLGDAECNKISAFFSIGMELKYITKSLKSIVHAYSLMVFELAL